MILELLHKKLPYVALANPFAIFDCVNGSGSYFQISPRIRVEINIFFIAGNPCRKGVFIMLKVFSTNVVVLKGYNGAPALKFSDDGGSVRFRIGKKVYDTHAENNTRWVNLSVKAFGDVCDRIKKMQLKEGSFINIIGRLDEDSRADQNTGEAKSMIVIILDEVEYAGSAKPKDGPSAPNTTGNAGNATAPAAPAQNPAASDNFTGYENFGGSGIFDEE